VKHEAEDLVADLVAADTRADPLDLAGEVAADGDRELVLGVLPQTAGRDEHVHWIDGGGASAHEKLVVADRRLGQVLAQDRLRVKAVEGKGSH
jgi:hypothetical protein